MEQFKVIIPAAGKSSRSGLSYPKTLYRIQGVPILIRILSIMESYDNDPYIIINPSQESAFIKVLEEFSKKASFLYQSEPKGMGDAVLKADRVIPEDTNIILIWSDIPLLSRNTLDSLVKCHVVFKNNFSLATSIGNDCYTIVDREEGKLVGVRETRALGIEPAKVGERDIGLFIFKKNPIFNFLAADAFAQAGKKEHGFLYIIEKLIKAGQKVEGFPIALPNDILSFNTPEELKMILEKVI